MAQNHAENQAEFGKLMKYVEENIQGRTVCQDCGCEYVTKYVYLSAMWILQCFGFGSAWIRIKVDILGPDPDPH